MNLFKGICPLPPATCRLPPATCPLPPATCPLPPATCPLPTADCGGCRLYRSFFHFLFSCRKLSLIAAFDFFFVNLSKLCGVFFFISKNKKSPPYGRPFLFR